MLNKILHIVAEGEVRTQQEIAEILNAPDPLVSQMVDHLVQEGYLAEAAQCSTGCEGCPMSAACGNGRKLKLWSLTPKGERTVRREEGASRG